MWGGEKVEETGNALLGVKSQAKETIIKKLKNSIMFR